MVWFPTNTLEPVVAKLPVEPLTSGITTPNVVPLPFVKVKVFPLKDAVVNPKLAEVFKLAVAEFILFIDVCCDAVAAFN